MYAPNVQVLIIHRRLINLKLILNRSKKNVFRKFKQNGIEKAQLGKIKTSY